jgi:hypothetical protein
LGGIGATHKDIFPLSQIFFSATALDRRERDKKNFQQ